jgi:hypothetical protein
MVGLTLDGNRVRAPVLVLDLVQYSSHLQILFTKCGNTSGRGGCNSDVYSK